MYYTVQADDRKAIAQCHAVYFAIIHPKWQKTYLHAKEFQMKEFITRVFKQVGMTTFSNTSYGKNYLIQTNVVLTSTRVTGRRNKMKAQSGGWREQIIGFA